MKNGTKEHKNKSGTWDNFLLSLESENDSQLVNMGKQYVLPIGAKQYLRYLPNSRCSLSLGIMEKRKRQINNAPFPVTVTFKSGKNDAMANGYKRKTAIIVVRWLAMPFTLLS